MFCLLSNFFVINWSLVVFIASHHFREYIADLHWKCSQNSLSQACPVVSQKSSMVHGQWETWPTSMTQSKLILNSNNHTGTCISTRMWLQKCWLKNLTTPKWPLKQDQHKGKLLSAWALNQTVHHSFHFICIILVRLSFSFGTVWTYSTNFKLVKMVNGSPYLVMFHG